jgi:PEP-CTERM motif
MFSIGCSGGIKIASFWHNVFYEVGVMNRKSLAAVSSAAIIAALVSATPAAAVVVYSQNFDSALGAEWTGATTLATTTGFPAPFSGSMLWNQTVGPVVKSTLTLTGLASHTTVDINFLLGFIDSWDSTDGVGGVTPDYFFLDVDGVNILAATAANTSGSINYSAGTPLTVGCPNFYNNVYCDKAFDVGSDPALTIAHTGSTLKLDFYAGGAGWQGGSDESWSIDNLSIDISTRSVGAVPEPATLLLFGSGLLGFSAFRRRKTKSKV